MHNQIHNNFINNRVEKSNLMIVHLKAQALAETIQRAVMTSSCCNISFKEHKLIISKTKGSQTNELNLGWNQIFLIYMNFLHKSRTKNFHDQNN